MVSKTKESKGFKERMEGHISKEYAKVEIRKFKESDKAAIVKLLEGLKDFITHVDKWDIETRKPEFGKTAFLEMLEKVKKGNSEIFIASLEGKIIGFARAETREKDKIDRMVVKDNIKYGEVHSLYVDAAHRKSNVGRKLMSVAESYLKEKGCTHIIVGVFWPNTGARNFYERVGYELYNADYIKEVK